MSDLLVLIEGELIGTVRADRSGRLTLEYESGWLASPQGYSLSLSMPRASSSYSHRPVLSYLWNLLPENPNVLRRWGQQYHVSAANPFELLSYVGADVPGAAQFIVPEQLVEMQSAHRPAIDWITVNELSERLRQLRADVAVMRRPGDPGKMSLPGAQAKTAFYWDEKKRRWGVPSGRAPTTHIIKPCMPGFDGLVENEHLCQEIAARSGLLAARSYVLELDQAYIVVERYDRLPPLPGMSFVQRIHQEDVCQTMGLMPGKKYQEEGGPGVAQIVTLIRRVSSAPELDVERFLQANMLNWLIGGTDAHAKNYSFLISAGDEVRLAPLYDLSSQLPYPERIAQRVAMKIGDSYDIPRIGGGDWRKLAQSCMVDEERVLSLLTEMARALPDHISDAREQALKNGLNAEVVGPLAKQLIQHCAERRATIDARRKAGKLRKRKRH